MTPEETWDSYKWLAAQKMIDSLSAPAKVAQIVTGMSKEAADWDSGILYLTRDEVEEEALAFLGSAIICYVRLEQLERERGRIRS